MAARRPNSRSQSEDACLAAPLLRAEDSGEGLRLDHDRRPREGERESCSPAGACEGGFASASARFLSQEWWAPSPPLPGGDGGQQRGSGWRPDKEGDLEGTQRRRKLGDKTRGLGAAGRRTTRTPKTQSALSPVLPKVAGIQAVRPHPRPPGPHGAALARRSLSHARTAHPAQRDTGRTWVASPEGKPG
ncbi:hypothetical protein NN561_018346 [Cricetulus griseus]